MHCTRWQNAEPLCDNALGQRAAAARCATLHLCPSASVSGASYNRRPVGVNKRTFQLFEALPCCCCSCCCCGGGSCASCCSCCCSCGGPAAAPAAAGRGARGQSPIIWPPGSSNTIGMALYCSTPASASSRAPYLRARVAASRGLPCRTDLRGGECGQPEASGGRPSHTPQHSHPLLSAQAPCGQASCVSCRYTLPATCCNRRPPGERQVHQACTSSGQGGNRSRPDEKLIHQGTAGAPGMFLQQLPRR